MKVEKSRSGAGQENADSTYSEPAVSARAETSSSPAGATQTGTASTTPAVAQASAFPESSVSTDGVTTFIDSTTQNTPPASRGWATNSVVRALLDFRIDDRIGRVLLSILLAVLLWFYVTNSENPAQTTAFTGLSVEVRHLPSDLSLINSIQTVDATIQAPQDIMNGLHQSDIHPYIDLAAVTAGVRDVPVQVDAPSLANAPVSINITPRTMQVQVELQTTQAFTVSVQVSGSPSLGYEAGEAGAQPGQVSATGLKTAVDRIKQVVVPVNINAVSSPITAQASPVALDSAGKPVTGVTFSPSTVQIIVPVTSFYTYQAKPIRPQVIGQPSVGYQAISINSAPDSVTVCCSKSILDQVQSLETEPINISGATGTVVTTTQLILPPNVALYPGTPNTVVITVSVQVLLTSLELSIQPTVQNVPPDYTVVVSPTSVNLTVAGTLTQLQALKPADIKLLVDAGGHDAGTFTLPLQSSVPDGLKLQHLGQNSVSVTLLAPTPVPSTATPTHAPTATLEPTAPPTQEPTQTLPAVAPEPTHTATPILTPIAPTPTHTPTLATPTQAAPTSTHSPVPTATLMPTTVPLLPSPTATPANHPGASPTPTLPLASGSATPTPSSGAGALLVTGPTETPTATPLAR